MGAQLLLVGLYVAGSLNAHALLADSTGSGVDGAAVSLQVAELSSELSSGPSARLQEEPQLVPLHETDTPTEDTKPTRILDDFEHTSEGLTWENARWVGFTPAVYTDTDLRPGSWILGPFDREERSGWITDVSTGATTRVTFRWRPYDGESRTALLSKQAASELGLKSGDVTSLAVYLPRRDRVPH